MKTGVSYFHTRDPEHAARDLDDMLEHGCNTVVHCYSEQDMAFYNRSMEKIVRMTRDRGMEVYLDPWGVGGMFGGETFSNFVAVSLESRQIDITGRSLPAACPNQPAFRDLMKRWIGRAAELGAQVCFWDEPHFYFNILNRSTWDTWACMCNECRRLFRQRYGFEMPVELNDEVKAFRRRSLLEFLEDVCDEAKRLGMKNCVCVLPDEGGGMGKAAGTAEWEKIALIPSLDIFGTDPYWILFGEEVEKFVRGLSMRVKEIADKYEKEAQAWVLAFIIPEGREEEVGAAVETIYDTGIRNILAWGYKGCHVIDITAKQPLKVWEILGEAYRKIHEKEERKS